MNEYTLGNKPELFDDEVDLTTAIPPTTSTIYATVFIESINGSVVTLGVGSNSVDPDDGQFAGTTNYDLVTELTATMVRQLATVAADTIIDGTLGNLVSVTQSANAVLTLTPADVALPFILDIFREATTGNPTLGINNAIYPSGIIPTYSAAPAADQISAFYIPAPIGKWLVFVAKGFTYQGTATFQESKGGKVLYIDDELHQKKIEKKIPSYRYLGRLKEITTFPMQMSVPEKGTETFALAAGQECVVSPTGDLYATTIIYDKPRNAYASEVELADTSICTILRMQTVVQASADITIDFLLGNTVYMVQNANISTITISNAPLNTVITLVRQKDATANIYTIAAGSNFYGEIADSPVVTGTANAIDVISFTTMDGGLTWRTSIVNDFR
jgi:hypothetical protein